MKSQLARYKFTLRKARKKSVSGKSSEKIGMLEGSYPRGENPPDNNIIGKQEKNQELNGLRLSVRDR
jgi:hypothetical protein